MITDRRWRAQVKNIAPLIRRALRAADCEAGVVLTDDRTVKKLNFLHRGRNQPTNVLTYENPPEILLAFGTVRREARAAGKTMGAHVAHLLVHGALHLRGYDHAHAGQARGMEARETRILARLGYKNPWKNR